MARTPAQTPHQTSSQASTHLLAAWQQNHQQILCPPRRYLPRALCAAMVVVAGLALYPVAPVWAQGVQIGSGGSGAASFDPASYGPAGVGGAAVRRARLALRLRAQLAQRVARQVRADREVRWGFLY